MLGLLAGILCSRLFLPEKTHGPSAKSLAAAALQLHQGRGGAGGAALRAHSQGGASPFLTSPGPGPVSAQKEEL